MGLSPGMLLATNPRTVWMVKIYPEGNIVYAHAIPEKCICETKLAQCLNCLGLDAVCLAGGGPLRAVVEDERGNAEADEIHSTIFNINTINMR